MGRRLLTTILLVMLASSAVCAAQQGVYVLPIEGEIDPGLSRFVTRVIDQAEQDDAVVLIEINTFGGLVESATEIRDRIIRARVPVVTFVSERAWSAGALITLAAPSTAMAPGSSIGAAEPRPMDEKTISALRAEFESTAERTGREPRIAAAMVDADVEIEGLVDKGKILTLSAQAALQEGYADVIVSGRAAVLEHFEYDGLKVTEFEPHWAERVARFLTNSTVSSLLLTLGFLGLIFEITSPGWGVPGTGGVLALVLFFGGRYVTGLAGAEVIIMFVLGILLLGLEIFVIPGFGLAGVLGILGISASIILSFENWYAGLVGLSIALSASFLAVIILWRRIVRSRFWKRLILSHKEEKELGYKGPQTVSDLIGKQGHTLTPLRPAGTAIIDGERYDVVSEGGFVAADSLVEVIMVEGTRIVVREVSTQS